MNGGGGGRSRVGLNTIHCVLKMLVLRSVNQERFRAWGMRCDSRMVSTLALVHAQILMLAGLTRQRDMLKNERFFNTFRGRVAVVNMSGGPSNWRHRLTSTDALRSCCIIALAYFSAPFTFGWPVPAAEHVSLSTPFTLAAATRQVS